MSRTSVNRLLLLGGSAIVLAGCASEPFSYLDGRRYFAAQMNVSNAAVVSVDGKDQLRNPVPVEPGTRQITLQAPAVGGFRFGEKRTITMNIEPCKHYYFAAVRETALSQDWQPKVDYVQDISGCGTAKGSRVN